MLKRDLSMYQLLMSIVAQRKRINLYQLEILISDWLESGRKGLERLSYAYMPLDVRHSFYAKLFHCKEEERDGIYNASEGVK